VSPEKISSPWGEGKERGKFSQGTLWKGRGKFSLGTLEKYSIRMKSAHDTRTE